MEVSSPGAICGAAAPARMMNQVARPATANCTTIFIFAGDPGGGLFGHLGVVVEEAQHADRRR